MDGIIKPHNLAPVELNPNAAAVLEKRYFLKDLRGRPLETAELMLGRVAGAVAAEESKYSDSSWRPQDLAQAFYDMMAGWQFLPNSPTLMNAGTDLGQLSACFVLPVGDSIEEIFDAVKFAAMIHKSGGGTGFSFSRLRPKDSRVGSTGGVASGPLSFLRIFNTATEQIKQGGTRRGANMGILRVDHPDILEFIAAKEKDGEFNNFNLSVSLTESFMQAVEKNEDYPLADPSGREISARLNARQVFDLLVRKAWESGDPGIIFIDRINRDNPNPEQGEIESTNPCGEQPLLPYEACNLGSINLSRFYRPGWKNQNEAIAWQELQRVIKLAVRFLDNVIDASRFPLEQINAKVQANRKVGLGVMGWADLLYCLKIPYNSSAATDLAGKIMSFIRDEARRASEELARERGPFPSYADSVYAREGLGPFRNATLTTIAPTGTLSILAGCSSGIEPLFALSFVRNVMDGARLQENNPYFEQALQQAGLFSRELMEKVAARGSAQTVEEIPEDIKKVFVTAMDIEAQWHLRMQAAFQKFTDNAVSKTVNLPNSAGPEDIGRVYWMAYQEGCKGVTVYRDGCKSSQVLYAGEGRLQEGGKAHASRSVRERPDIVYGFTRKVRTGHGLMYVTINEVAGRPFEVFATIGKSGRSTMAKAEAIGRLVSLALRSDVELSEIIKQIKGISGEMPVYQPGKQGLVESIPDGIAWVLEDRYLKAGRPVDANGLGRERCPECDEVLLFQEGCLMCPACAFTRCN
ncbi:MAG: vitamin B12-dependent ribonucleotide reductase [Desulfarculales bacterium]|nr:vitamin B12-dependent ribonucleotide reductase [Desulfarculales bacterium]